MHFTVHCSGGITATDTSRSLWYVSPCLQVPRALAPRNFTYLDFELRPSTCLLLLHQVQQMHWHHSTLVTGFCIGLICVVGRVTCLSPTRSHTIPARELPAALPPTAVPSIRHLDTRPPAFQTAGPGPASAPLTFALVMLRRGCVHGDSSA